MAGKKGRDMAAKHEEEERAVPENIRGAQEDAAQRQPPYPGDGTNTGETTPEGGPEPGVTAVHAESHPEVPPDAHARQAYDEGITADESADANATGGKR